MQCEHILNHTGFWAVRVLESSCLFTANPASFSSLATSCWLTADQNQVQTLLCVAPSWQHLLTPSPSNWSHKPGTGGRKGSWRTGACSARSAPLSAAPEPRPPSVNPGCTRCSPEWCSTPPTAGSSTWCSQALPSSPGSASCRPSPGRGLTWRSGGTPPR